MKNTLNGLAAFFSFFSFFGMGLLIYGILILSGAMDWEDKLYWQTWYTVKHEVPRYLGVMLLVFGVVCLIMSVVAIKVYIDLKRSDNK